MVYANRKNIDRAYGVWLRAPNKNAKTQNIGAKWLRNSQNGSQSWNSGNCSEGINGERNNGMVSERFKEIDGIIAEIQGGEGTVMVKQQSPGFVDVMDESGKPDESESVVVETKRKRVANTEIDGNEDKDSMVDCLNVNEPKNGPEAGTGLQARLGQ